MITTTTYGKLPAIRIAAPDGAQAIVTLYGAHLVSWKSSDGKERLFMSSASALDGSKAIRGGVPVIFPQFAERGAGLRHGFARTSTWRHIGDGVSAGATYADFELGEDEWDGIISIFVPLPSELRKVLYSKLPGALKTGGVFLVEAYTPEQIKHGTGGGNSPDTMQTAESLKLELPSLKFEHLIELEREVIEGNYHTGTGSVVQAIAQKR